MVLGSWTGLLQYIYLAPVFLHYKYQQQKGTSSKHGKLFNLDNNILCMESLSLVACGHQFSYILWKIKVLRKHKFMVNDPINTWYGISFYHYTCIYALQWTIEDQPNNIFHENSANICITYNYWWNHSTSYIDYTKSVNFEKCWNLYYLLNHHII